MTSSYSKICVFVSPHVNKKPNICTLESVFEKMRFRWLFSPDRTVDQTGGEKKKNGSNKNGYVWTGPLLRPAKVRSIQCSAKPAVPGSQAVETSREQVKQKQGARFSRQFWRSLHVTISEPGTGWHCSAVRRGLFKAFRLREWREQMWAGKTVRGWGRGCFPALWYFCAALHYVNACNRLSQADLRFFILEWLPTLLCPLQRALDLDDLSGKKNKQTNKQQQQKPKELRWGEDENSR